MFSNYLKNLVEPCKRDAAGSIPGRVVFKFMFLIFTSKSVTQTNSENKLTPLEN